MPFDLEDDPQAYPTSLPIRTAEPHLQMAHVAPKRRPVFTVGNGMLVLIILTFGLYATGNLPQFDRFFDGLHTSLHARNDSVVGTILHFGPLLLLGFLFLIFFIFAMLRIFVRPAPLSDDMAWHANASAVSRPIVALQPRAPTATGSFLQPLHKQPQIHDSLNTPSPAITIEIAGVASSGPDSELN